MYVAIDYLFGTHGNFLQYLCDVFIYTTAKFHDPFVLTGASHNRIKNPHTKFAEDHYFGNIDENLFTHVVSIETTVDDAIKLMAVRLHKRRDPYYFLHHFHPRKWTYRDLNLPVFYFRYSHFYDYELLVNELQQMCKFLSLPEFQPSERFNFIYQKFLSHHSYLFSLDNETTPLGNIVQQMKLQHIDSDQGDVTFYIENEADIERLCVEYAKSVNTSLQITDLYF